MAAAADAGMVDCGSRDLLGARLPVVFAYNGGIGDRLCNLPALRALAHVFEGRAALVCRTGDRDMYYSGLPLRTVHELDFELIEAGFRFDAESLAHRVGACDLLVCINPWHTDSVSTLLARLSHPRSIGFFADFDNHLTCDFSGHAIDMAFAVPASLDPTLRPAEFSGPPAISAEQAATARQIKREYFGASKVLFVHMDTKPDKMWPRARFERVLDRFLRARPDYRALVIDLRNEWSGHRHFEGRLVSVALPLDTTFALLRECNLFLGIDSCHLHAADLFRIPGVGIFGPTTSRRWGYRFSPHHHFQGQGTTLTIGVEEVSAALLGLARGGPA
jgi:hypothetical protein